MEWVLIILFVPLLLGGATVTGKQEELCARIGGTFTPAPHGENVCPGGDWTKLFSGSPK